MKSSELPSKKYNKKKNFADGNWPISIKSNLLVGLTMSLVVIAGFFPLLIAVKLGMSSFLFAIIIYSIFISAVFAFAALFLRKNYFRKKSSGVDRQPLEHIGDGIFLFDKMGEPEFISDSAKKLFSCQKFELSGSGLIDRIHVMDRPLYMRAFSQARMELEKQTVTIRMRKDNLASKHSVIEYIWVETSLSPLIQRGGESAPFEVIAMFKDVGKQKHEAELLAKNKQNEKTDSEAKTQFLAMIGHELRTPLNSIVGFSDLMINEIGGELAPTQLEYVKNISQSGYHLLDVVNSLLDMSKLEAGKFELYVAKFDLYAIIEPSIQIISSQARDKNVKIEVDIEENLPSIMADERACRQIVINLLSNAIKFSQPNSDVICSIKRQGHFLKLSVRDQGIGMDKEHVEKFGEPFFQAHVGSKRNYEGTGLGISIVKGLVDLHQGRLEVKSKMGVGSIISVLLPIDGLVANSETLPAYANSGVKNYSNKKHEKIILEQRKAV